ncbi:MAG TPA: hypothetical protein DEA26_01195 [Oceanospirillales bacterium]|nr:hypothetical protein [Oceanospirillaceae bacterium]HBS41265.1 hypothetical protein [Oceanospirillales bacterium]|tara:strand:- start:3426 stop:4256 length:831 start_codon:yes stop_codon:yes gene_type:complete
MNMNAIFAESVNLPHIPKVVQELIISFQDENIDIDILSDKVSKDQSLTAKVLRLANSAHYGMRKNVANPHDAVMLLGFEKLRNMVLASGLTGAFKVESYDMNKFWKQAFAVAAISKWLAGYVPGVQKETVFTCGMVHSIGDLLIRVVMPEQAARIDQVEALGKTERHLIENGQLGFDYAEVGAELARRWRFPEVIHSAIAQQNWPSSGQTGYTKEAGIVYIARYLQRAYENNLSEEAIISGFPCAAAAAIGLDLKKAQAGLVELGGIESGLDGLLD